MRRPSGHRINHRDDRKPSLSVRRGAGDAIFYEDDAIFYEDDASIDDAEDGMLLPVRRPGWTGALSALNDNRPNGSASEPPRPASSPTPPDGFTGGSIPAA